MTARTSVGSLSVAQELYDFIDGEVLPLTQVDPQRFWEGLERALTGLASANDELLAERDRLQRLIDGWLGGSVEVPSPSQSEEFLTRIGYLRPPPAPFEITTVGVDEEICTIAGPQLVVPVLNARFALNAVNARWGSLYDALYGTDAMGFPPGGTGYDPKRGKEVVRRVRAILDDVVPLDGGSHADVTTYLVEGGQLIAHGSAGESWALRDPSAYRGHVGPALDPRGILLRHHGLHLELIIDRAGAIGASDRAGIDDVLLESALTTIVDLEDSVAAVDAEDKVAAYRNWLGLNCGTLEEAFEKGGRRVVRTLADDRRYTTTDGSNLVLPGRALMLVRNVGLHMRTDAVLDRDGNETYEGILDAFVTVLAALPGLRDGARRNSRTGSVYVVKPKLHGPDEVAFTSQLYEEVEDVLGLPRATVKIGVMDEERRTSVNLAACILAVRDRVVFINTGFLDRSGDEIHTGMHAGVMVPKSDMRSQPWLAAYEDRNVDVGLAVGFRGRAQIGKGMWPMPDLMADMLAQKIAHPEAGATTAWVPSPTAATLHALHYHRVDVRRRQDVLAARGTRSVRDLLEIPLAISTDWSDEARTAELEDNLQSILGYVVRWVDQGIGCSKVPDSRDVALMEDRATLRISSQLMANWLLHGLITEDEIRQALLRVAVVVDQQNAADPSYRPISGDPEANAAFQASLELVIRGTDQPSGYCEPILHHWRRRVKGAAVAAS